MQWIAEAFGRRLTSAITLRGIKAIDLAAEIGVNRSYITMLCQGKKEPSLSTLLALSQVLKTDPGWLAFGFAGTAGAPTAAASAFGATPLPGTPDVPAPQTGVLDPQKAEVLRVLGGQLPGKPAETSPGVQKPAANPKAIPPKAPDVGPRKPGKPRAYANRSSPKK